MLESTSCDVVLLLYVGAFHVLMLLDPDCTAGEATEEARAKQLICQTEVKTVNHSSPNQ